MGNFAENLNLEKRVLPPCYVVSYNSYDTIYLVVWVLKKVI